MSTSKPRRANRWPALKRRIEAAIIKDYKGVPFGAGLEVMTEDSLAYTRTAIRRLTRWGCKVTLPRS